MQTTLRPSPWRSVIAALATVLAAPSAAQADAIGPSPPCPPGEYLESGAHSAPFCGAQTCTVHEDCPLGEACMPYCDGGNTFFTAPQLPTGRCTAETDCGDSRCRPLYCEPGARGPLFVPGGAGSGGENGDGISAAGAVSTAGSASTGGGSATGNQEGLRGVSQQSGCVIGTALDRRGSSDGRGLWACAIALGVALRRRHV